MLLVALYESWFYPIVLILGVPLGIVGALLGLFVTHNTLNIFSIIGLIMAVGLVAKNGHPAGRLHEHAATARHGAHRGAGRGGPRAACGRS